MTIILLGKPFSLVVLLLLHFFFFPKHIPKNCSTLFVWKKGVFWNHNEEALYLWLLFFFFFFSLLSISISSKIKAYSYIGGWTFYLFFLLFKWPLFLFVLEHCFFGTRSKNNISFIFFSNLVTVFFGNIVENIFLLIIFFFINSVLLKKKKVQKQHRWVSNTNDGK